MKLSSIVRPLLGVLAALALSACEMTTFEAAPLAAADCDPTVAGRWLSMDEDPAKNGELTLIVSDTCELVMESREKDGVKRSTPTAVHLGQQGLYRYAWVDARWALAQFDEDHGVPKADVYLLRLARDGDRLSIWTIDDKAVAHAIINGDLAGSVAAQDHDLFNRLTGTGEAAVLDHPGLFKADPVAFARQADETP